MNLGKIILTGIVSFLFLSCNDETEKNDLQGETETKKVTEAKSETKPPEVKSVTDKPEPDVSPQEKDQVRKAFDYSLGLEPVNPAHMSFEQYKNSNLLIFYFLPSCPHCQKSIGPFQNLSEELSEQGFRAIAVSSGSAPTEEIQEFHKEQNVQIPLFKDSQKRVRILYGTGSVPMVMAVNKDGTYYRFEEYHGDSSNDKVKETVASW